VDRKEYVLYPSLGFSSLLPIYHLPLLWLYKEDNPSRLHHNINPKSFKPFSFSLCVCNTNMASNVVLASSQQPKKGDLSLFASSDLEIMNQIYATHVHNDEKFDVESLFIVVENILKRATQIVDNVVLVWYHIS
jgi:hypothetical protein